MRSVPILGLIFGAFLLLGYAPAAVAMPASPGIAAGISNDDGLVVKAVTRAGVAHRSARRTARRVNRRNP